MNRLAFVTARASLPDDHDMPILLEACRKRGIGVEVCDWHDPAVRWQQYDAVILRSPWDYTEQLPVFLDWCEQIAKVTSLFNPLAVVKWCLDKHYLADLDARGVPVVPTEFVEPGASPEAALERFLSSHPSIDDFVVKPAIGCYSKNVRRYARNLEHDASEHISALIRSGNSVLLQPFLPSIDECGETDIIYFNDLYSHAIRKAAMLSEDGTVNVPTYDFRSARHADEDEQAVAVAALEATVEHLHLARPLLYARVDMIRDPCGNPRLLELDIAEPSLSFPIAEAGADRFADALAEIASTEEGVRLR